MKRKLLFLAAIVASALGFNAHAKQDVTELIANADLSQKDKNWQFSDGYTDWGTGADADHVNVMEFWAGKPYKDSKFKVSQEVTLPAGYYHLVINAFYRNGWSGDGTNNNIAWIFAGETKQNVVALTDQSEITGYTGSNDMWKAGNAFKQGKYKNEFDFQVTKEGKIEIGLEGENFTGGSWCIFGPVQLFQYQLQDYIDLYNEKVAEAEEIKSSTMNASVRLALEEAAGKAEELASKEIEDVIQATKELEAAIVNANNSITIFKTSKTAIDAMYAILEGTNVYTRDAYDAYKALADEYLAKYEAGELTEIVVNPNAATGHHAGEQDKDNAVHNFIISAWGADAYDWSTYHVNTWSVEGDTDGSNFTVPFIEDWTENSNALAAKEITATLENMNPGDYEVSALVRVRAKDGTAATDAAGITLAVNDGEAVDVTEGEQVGSTLFSLGEYKAVGTVGEDGNLVIKFNVATTNISWLAFKNVKYTKLPVNIEIGNYAFDENEEDVVTVTTEGYGGNVKETDHVAGLQPVQAWTRSKDEPNPTTSGEGYTGGVFAYGSTNLLNNKIAAPKTNPEGGEEGVALGVVALWSGTAQYTQEVTLPAGNYTITYPVYNGANNTQDITKNLFGFISEDGTENLSTQKRFTLNEWKDVTVEFTLYKKTKGVVSIGYTAMNNGSSAAPHLFVDHVSVVQQSDVELADAQAYLLGKLEALSPVGEGLFYYQAEDIAKVKAAIESAKTQKDIDAIEMPEMTLPVEGQAYIFTLTTSDGLQLSVEEDKNIKIQEEGTPLYLVAQGNGKYALSPAEGEYIYYSPNEDGPSKNNWSIKAGETVYGWTINALADGTYTLEGDSQHNRGNDRYIGVDDTAANSTCYGNKNNANIYWTIAEYVPVYSVTVGEAGYATYVTPVALTFEEEQAYTVASLSDDKTVAVLEAVTAAPAGTPLIIKGEGEVIFTPAEEEPTEVASEYLFAATEEVPAAEGIFVLAKPEGAEVGFYALNEGESVPAGKAYLKLPEDVDTTQVKFIGFGNGNATAIELVEVSPATENSVIYNLAGQRVQNPVKGIYIVNGKKVLVK